MRYWFFLFWFAVNCQANSVYIAQNAAGAADGSSAANALPVTYFNNGANWSGGSPSGTQIGPGTIVHLCNVISSPLTVQGSGTAGNSITILFESNASMSAPDWTATGAAITCNNKNYIVIDGGSNGVITATNQNSSSGLGSNGINCYMVTNVEVRNLQLLNLYDKTQSSDLADHAGTAINAQYGSNISVHDNVISNAGAGIFYTYLSSSLSSNISLYRNTISACNWGIGSGDGNGGALVNNFQIYDNTITMPGTQWDDPADDNHHNGIYVWANFDGSTITGLQIYGNYIYGNAGVNSTAFIYISANADTSHGLEGALLYDNLLVATAGGANDGCIFVSCDGFGVYNNTIVSINQKGGMAIREYTGGEGAPTTGVIANNILYNWGTTTYEVGGVTVLTYLNNLENVNPLFVNGTTNFQLTSGSPAIGAGLNEFALFAIDAAGNARPSIGPWDIGAYQYGAAQSTPTPAPTPNPTPAPTPTQSPNPNPTPAQSSMTIGETGLLPITDGSNGNLMVAQNAVLSQAGSLQSLSFYVTQVGGTLRLGLYDATGPNSGPGTKLAETNEISPVLGWNTASVITPVTLAPGTYWLAYLPSSNSLQFLLTLASGSYTYYSFPYGVMPATYSTSPGAGIGHWSFYATLNTVSADPAPTPTPTPSPTPPWWHHFPTN